MSVIAARRRVPPGTDGVETPGGRGQLRTDDAASYSASGAHGLDQVDLLHHREVLGDRLARDRQAPGW